MEIRFYHEWNDHKRNQGTPFKKRLDIHRFQQLIHEKARTLLLTSFFLASALVFGTLLFQSYEGQALQEKNEANQLIKPEPIYYTVKDGDTLWSISARYYPEKDRADAIGLIQQSNSLEGATIYVGQRLRLP